MDQAGGPLRMNGAMINALGIVLGGAWGLAVRKPVSPSWQMVLKFVFGVYLTWFGLKLTWFSINGGFRQCFAMLGIVLLAMSLGKLIGQLLRLQKFSNSVGRHASQTLAAPSPRRFNDGFLMATGLFCVGPLAILASVQEGLNGFSPIFIVKAAMDGLATCAFCQSFGWGAALSAIPVLAFENALICGARILTPHLHQHAAVLVDSINATNGLLIFCVALIVLELKRIHVADYFPSLAIAPLLTWWLWR
jgi:uncharacterized membrane protein YqgA involved in biofilm formation